MNPKLKIPQLDILDDGHVLRIVLPKGAFDSSLLRDFKDSVNEAWRDRSEHVEIDFSQVTFIDSPMVGVLLVIYKQQETRKPITILNPNAAVRNTFVLFQMSNVFDLRYSSEAA